MKTLIIFLFSILSFSSIAQVSQNERNKMYEGNIIHFKETSKYLNQYYKIQFCNCNDSLNNDSIYFYTYYDSRIVYSDKEEVFPKHRIITIDKKEKTYSKYYDLEILKSNNSFSEKPNTLKEMDLLPKQTFDLKYAIWRYLHPRYHFIRYCKDGNEIIKSFSEAIDVAYSGIEEPSDFDESVKQLKKIESFIYFFDTF